MGRPADIPPRGTVIVLPGRGETAAEYGRLGRRLSADAYLVRVVGGDAGRIRAEIESLLADESLPSPRVLVGSDTGATLAAALVEELPVDAAVVAGLALPSLAAPAEGWEDELEVRTACPTHRRVLGEDSRFVRGALTQPVPADVVPVTTRKPVLVVHGGADPVTTVSEAYAAFAAFPAVELHRVEGGRHDVLNDVSHRSVAATIVLFLERVKLGVPTVITRLR